MTATSVIVSIVLCIAVVLSIGLLHATQRCYDVLQARFNEALQFGDMGVEVAVGSMDGTLMKTVPLNDVSLFISSGSTKTVVATMERVEVSSSVWNVVKAAIGFGGSHLDVSVYNPRIDVSNEALDFIASLSSDVEESNADASGALESTASPTRTLDVSMSIGISNATILVGLDGIETEIAGVNAFASFGDGLSFVGADLNVPQIRMDVPGIGATHVDDVRLSLDSAMELSASVEGIELDGVSSNVRGVSAIADIKEGRASIAAYAQSMETELLGFSAVFNDPVFNVEVGVGSSEGPDDLSFAGSLPYASISSRNEDLTIDLEQTILSGSLNGSGDGIGLDVSVVSANVLSADGSLHLEDIGVNADVSLSLGDLEFTNALGSMKVSYAVAKVGGNDVLDVVSAKGLELDASFQNGDAELRLKASVDGTSQSRFIGDFSSDVEANVSASLESGVSRLGAVLSDLEFAAIPNGSDLSLEYRAHETAALSFSIKEDLDGTVDFSLTDGTLATRLYVQDLNPYAYEVLYREFLSSQDLVLEDTSFDGSIALSVELEKGFEDSFVEYVLNSAPTLDALKDMVSAGRISTNIAVHDLNVEERNYSGAVSFEASLDDTLLDVGTLAISTGGFRLSYAGRIDYNQLVPDGMLSLQNAKDGSELARLDFDSIDDTMLYSFSLTSPLSEGTSIDGTLDWQDSSTIKASATLTSNILTQSRLPFSVTVEKSPLAIVVESDDLNLDARFSSQSVFSVDGMVHGLSVRASDSLDVVVGMGLDVSYDVMAGSFDVLLDDLTVKLSDILGVGFSTHITDKDLTLYGFSVTRDDSTTEFTGSLDVTYASLADLLSLDPSLIEATLDIADESSGTYAKGKVVDGDYFLDARLSSLLDVSITTLGSKDYGFHSYGTVEWGDGGSGFSFKSQYRGGRLGFYDSFGRIGGLELNDVGLSLDFNDMSMEFSFSFRNVVERPSSSDAVQSGTIALTGRLETLASSFLSAVAGLDTDISFGLSLRDFQLEDGFEIPDTSVDILYSKGLVTLEGDLINGMMDTSSGYIELDIDRSFLFGFKAKGYIGDELDVSLRDVYFPLPLVEQFADLMLMGFTKGDITGDVLIKGPVNDPKFYGMLYCQLFEMWLAYLPEQSLVVNNIAITLQDHSITIPKTPYTGYSGLDGRYLYGLVSVSMDVQNLDFGNMEVDLDVQTPVDLWVPLPMDSSEIEVRGDAVGKVVYGLRNGSGYLDCIVTASDMLVDFKIDDRPRWLDFLTNPIDLDVTLTTGNDVEFCYPEKDNAFIDFTLNEGETIRATYQVDTKKVETSGALSFKTGQVYYFQNDFYISEGSLDLTPRKFGTSINGISFQLNLTARLKDYDASGDRVEINLILQNATLDNITPRFTSTPSMSETEIIALLGQTILPSSTFDQQVSVASVASLAAAATDAFTRLGVIESNGNYSLSATIRDSLGLDIFSLRSSILQNIIIDALPGGVSGRSDISLLSRYLDGTSIFAGSYILPGVFAQTSLRLKADRSGGRNANVGHFLSNDLMLDMEFSIDWDNPIGTFTIFTKPQELSPFSILDSIGFSVTKRIQF